MRDEVIDDDEVAVLCCDGPALELTEEALLLSPPPDSAADCYHSRVVLLSGLEAEAGSALRDAMAASGLLPAVVGRSRPGEPLRSVADSLLAAHEAHHGLRRPLRTHATAWRPESARPALHATLSARDREVGEAEADEAEPRGALVVLDGLLSGAEARTLLEAVTEAGFDERAAAPAGRWERETRDRAGAADTWGLTEEALQSLLGDAAPPIVIELQSRLAALYPECQLYHLPGEQMDTEAAGGVAAPLVGNAACAGDSFSWHRDAQPALLDPASAWAERWGLYTNGRAGKPLLVSAVVYLNAEWAMSEDAETLFADEERGCGLFVRPRAGRVALMHQDLLHRICAPSPAAGRPRFSLVWKLLLLPRGGEAASISRPEWGAPLRF